MASVHETPSVPLNGIVQGAEQYEDSDSDPENIPYHARENALPFTYGNVPKGFQTSDLNHVGGNEHLETLDQTTSTFTHGNVSKGFHNNDFNYAGSNEHLETFDRATSPYTYGKVPVSFNTKDLHHVGSNERMETVGQNKPPTSPSVTRKSTRPNISTSCPLLRKTPTRQEFEDMLMERKVQAVDSQQDLARKLVQNESIQKDLDELHRRLNTPSLDTNKELVKHIESIDLPDAELCSIIKPKNLDLQLVEKKRSQTPTFPIVKKSVSSERCVSPYPAPRLPNTLMIQENSAKQEARQDAQPIDCVNHTKEVAPHLVKFAKDSSEFWYKPNMTREEAVDLLRHVEPGTFLIRNSTTYRDAFGLVLRVAKPPPGVVTGPGYGDQLVRHFLLEPTTRGVRLMGCTNEPMFTSLSAFVYEHSINPMSLPCTLKIPDQDLMFISANEELISKQKQVLVQGAACNVLYLFQSDMESLTGDDAVRKAVFQMHSEQKRPIPLEVHFKISEQGITLTDNTRTKFFRRHYPAANISHFCMDPNNHLWSVAASDEGLQRTVNKSIFAFIARPLTGSKDNQCHIFCDLSSLQPASAIVSFAHKVLPLYNSRCKVL